MLKRIIVIFILALTSHALAQTKPVSELDSVSEKTETIKNEDSLKKRNFIKNIGNGYLPTKYFNFDLQRLIKFNQYEGLRTGLGGTTNDAFSEKFRVNGYFVYGFTDKASKYSFGGGYRLSKATNTWINVLYTDDLQETGSSKFLTDKRFFSFFEPRLLNIDLFHEHITKSLSLEHKISDHLLSETEFAVTDISPTYNYQFVNNGKSYSTFDLTTATLSLQWSPFSKYQYKDKSIEEVSDGYPQFTTQFTKSFSDVFNSDFNFTKIDFRTLHKIDHGEQSLTSFTLVAGLALGETPLTHLYHAYPNNITKETILQRFSVAGLNSFETMFFNEFFSDRFSTFQVKHYLTPFKISRRFQPQMVLISRFALGDMESIEQHQGVSFNTLNKLYSEAGFEINKLLFGFGLSFAYRYGGYHLPNFEDNLAFKFTFNIAL